MHAEGHRQSQIEFQSLVMVWWRNNWLLQPCKWFVLIKCQSFSKLLTNNPYLPLTQSLRRHNGKPLASPVLSGFLTCIGWIFMYSERAFHSMLMGLLSNTICHTFFPPGSRNPCLVMSASLTPNLTGFSAWDCNDLTPSHFTSLNFWRNTSASAPENLTSKLSTRKWPDLEASPTLLKSCSRLCSIWGNLSSCNTPSGRARAMAGAELSKRASPITDVPWRGAAKACLTCGERESSSSLASVEGNLIREKARLASTLQGTS